MKDNDRDNAGAQRAFFGRRKGHALKPRQAALFDTLLPKIGLDLATPAPADLRALFARPVDEVRLEIGFGGAEHLIAQAEVNPTVGYIGTDAFLNGVAKALAAIDVRKLDKNVLKTTAQRFVALAEEGSVTAALRVPLPHFTIDTEHSGELLQRMGLDGTRIAVGLMPGAEYGPAKQWTAAQYAELAQKLAADGIQSWVFGSAKEKELGEAIRQGSGGAAVNLCGRTTLTEVVDLAARCIGVVTNDSGPMHIAAATGVPVVAIYGSSTPDFTPPLTQHKAIHYLRLDCSPCFERTCPLGHYNCLRQITPTDVRASLKRLTGL